MPNALDLPEGGLEEAIAGCLGLRHELKYPGSSPQLGRENLLVAVSDYKGRYGNHPYSQTGLLLASKVELDNWLGRLAQIRDSHEFRRTMEYKGLRDRHRSRLLPEWLRAAGRISGILVFFEVQDGLTLMPERYKPRGFKALVAEEAARVICLVGLTRACFARSGSALEWVTDDDDIVANSQLRGDLLRYAEGLCNAYLPIGELVLRTASEGNGGEDLVSLPDLIVGALAEASNSLSRSGKDLESWVGADLPLTAKPVLEWWCSDKALQTRYVRISEAGPGSQVSLVRLRADPA
jgi:hypothetical protein